LIVRPLAPTSAAGALCLAGVIAALASGCASHAVVYKSDAPMTPATSSTSGASRFVVADVVVPSSGPGLATVIDADVPAGTTMGAARLAPAGGAACASGNPVAVVSIDGRPHWERPLSLAGRQRLTLDFPLRGWSMNGDGQRPTFETIDLTLATASGGAGCLRLPLPQADRLRKRSAWSVGGNFSFEPPFLAAYSGVARLGRWFGPLRVGAELGASILRCIDCVSTIHLGAPAALTVEVVAAKGLGIGIGIEAAYTARPVIGLGGSDRDRYFIQGPRATVRLLVTTPRDRDRPGGPQLGYGSLDLWLARWSATGDEHWSETLLGLGVTWDSGL
jgi:hypothetical protein